MHFAFYRLVFEDIIFLTVVEFHKVKFIKGFLLQKKQITVFIEYSFFLSLHILSPQK